MRKIAVVVLALMLVAGTSFALDSAYKTYSVERKNATGAMQISNIGITTIRPNIDKLIGYSIIPLDLTKAAECYISIMDDTDISLDGEVFAESEAEHNYGKSEFWAKPRYIFNGITVAQGTNTQVQLYFVTE